MWPQPWLKIEIIMKLAGSFQLLFYYLTAAAAAKATQVKAKSKAKKKAANEARHYWEQKEVKPDQAGDAGCGVAGDVVLIT